MALRPGEIAVILLCVSSIVFGTYLIYLASDSESVLTSPLTASAIPFIGIGAVGILLVWRLAIVRGNPMAPKWIALCVVVTIAATSLTTLYVLRLGFGSA